MINGLLDKLFGSDEKVNDGMPKNIKHGHSDIGELLTMYQDQNHLMTAIIMNPRLRKIAKLSTGIISVNLDEKRFLTDEFLPAESNQLLVEGMKVQFSLTHHGVRHQFEALYLQSPSSSEGVHHQFEFPKGIEQIQLRDAFRVKLSQAHPIKVTLTHASNAATTGTLADLSASGMRIRIEGLVTPKPIRGEQYTSCHLVLSDGNPIVCSAKLMHWQYDPDLRISFLGVHFENMDGNTQRTLNRYLTDLQRKQRLTP
jgi:c-di-GMP-binding flagellar brake protein YcgR